MLFSTISAGLGVQYRPIILLVLPASVLNGFKGVQNQKPLHPGYSAIEGLNKLLT
jgi:hypothetical protein